MGVFRHAIFGCAVEKVRSQITQQLRLLDRQKAPQVFSNEGTREDYRARKDRPPMDGPPDFEVGEGNGSPANEQGPFRVVCSLLFRRAGVDSEQNAADGWFLRDPLPPVDAV
jgi:hypothetical protein